MTGARRYIEPGGRVPPAAGLDVRDKVRLARRPVTRIPPGSRLTAPPAWAVTEIVYFSATKQMTAL